VTGMDGKLAIDLAAIMRGFDIQGAPGEIIPLKIGHIHDTFRVQNLEPASPDYLLQRINVSIFKDPAALMENIGFVTRHIRRKLEAIPGSEPAREVLTVVPSNDGRGYLRMGEEYWRLYRYIDKARSYDMAETGTRAFEGGRVFGRFLSLVADLDPSRLHDTIPRFHDVENRYSLFQRSLQADPLGRASEVRVEIAFVERRIASMSLLNRLGRQGVLPLRIVHNDAKFNNALFDESGKALCVVDLDTTMPGYIAYDFGDALRTIVGASPEDEKDLSKISVNLDLLCEFARGFLAETAAFVSRAEVDSLAEGVLLMPFIMGLRFLTDYIDGDRYYKIVSPAQNLQRARAQFRLTELLEERRDEIRDIVNRWAPPDI